MKITNKFNLPSTIADALATSQARYSKGDAWMSVTGLQRSPRISLLSKKHWKKLEEDVSDSVWKLFGSAVHTILEDGGTGSNALIKEERLSMDVLGQTISGAIDIQEITDFGIEITDYKVTRAISAMPNSFSLPSWTEQLNAYATLVEENKGLPVTRLSICAILRDHSPAQVERQADYPAAPIVTVEIDLWPKEQRLEWLEKRVQAHLGAELTLNALDTLPLCTDEERWKRGDKWAIKTNASATRAKKVFESEADALEFKADNSSWVVEHRPAVPVRCTSYCEVAKFCDQYQTEILK
jgi:hypothetical protein